MIEPPKYPLIKPPEELDAVAKSIAKPHAFAKAGTMGSKNVPHGTKNVRFRPLTTKQPPGRQRKRKPDPRKVHYF